MPAWAAMRAAEPHQKCGEPGHRLMAGIVGTKADDIPSSLRRYLEQKTNKAKTDRPEWAHKKPAERRPRGGPRSGQYNERHSGRAPERRTAPNGGHRRCKSRRYTLKPSALSGAKKQTRQKQISRNGHTKTGRAQTMRRPYGASRTAGHATGRAAGNITSGAAAAPQRDEPRPMAADEGHIAGRQRPERTHCGGRTPFAGSFLKKVVKERKNRLTFAKKKL